VRWLSRLVSIVSIVVVVAIALLILRSRLPRTRVGQHFHTYALFRDASRLAVGSPVRIAGVRVGEVTKLTIVNGLARLDLRLLDSTDIPADAWITKRAESAFGDSYLEIIPQTAGEGASSARRLRSGEPITHVIEGTSTDTALRSIARTLPKIDRGLEAVHDFALDGRRWSSGKLQDAIVGADHWVAAGHLQAPLDSADQAMERFESGSTRAARAVAGARPQIDDRIDQIDQAITKARARMADLKTGLSEAMARTRSGLDRVDPTVDQMSDVMAAVNEGSGADWKGQLGRLVNDPHLADTLEDVTEAGRGVAANLTPFKSFLGVRGEWDVYSGNARIYITAKLRARNDKFYLIELEKGPLGALPADQLDDVVNAARYDRYQSIRDSLRFTFQFGKTFFRRLDLRGGIKDSTFGVGADLLLGQGRLRFSADLFGSFTKTPRLKLAAAVEVFRSLYVTAGVDDVLNRPGYLQIIEGNTSVPQQFDKLRYGRDYFLGASLQFTDEDLATILRAYGAMLAGFL
jgi:phospholipid/cholesterol/gamma-HCH transport system substrate-binding protein